MRLLTNCAICGVIVAGWALTLPAAGQTSESKLWIPDESGRFEHGWFWDPTAESWKYGWFQPGNIQPRTVTREFALAGGETRTVGAVSAPVATVTAPVVASSAPMPTELRGTILNIEQRRISDFAPPQVFVTVHTEDGAVRTLDLGAATFVFRTVPDLHTNQQIVLRGNIQGAAGGNIFVPIQFVTARSMLALPVAATNRQVRGALVNLYTIPGQADFEKMLVAQVRTHSGDLVDVVLGSTDQVGNRFFSLRPGTPFIAEGFVEQTPSGSRLYAQNVRIQEQQPAEVVVEQPSALVFSTEPVRTAPFGPAPVSPVETVQGQIVGLQTQFIGGQLHLVADLTTDAGYVMRADLGPTAGLDYLGLGTGELVSVTGQRLFVDGQPILVADQLAVRGQVIYVGSMPQLVGAVETAAAAPLQMYHGRIVAKRTEDIPGYRDSRLVVDLRLDDGRVVPVDLGLKRCLRKMDLDRNDCITVWATSGLVDGQPGLIATQLADDDNRYIVASHCE